MENIVFYVVSNLIIRDFIKSGALDELEKKYNVYYLIDKNRVSVPINKKNVIPHDFSYKDARLRVLVRAAFIIRVSRHSSSYRLLHNTTWTLARIIKIVLSWPPIFEVLRALVEFIVKPDIALCKKIEAVKPKLIIVPTTRADKAELDFVKIAKILKIKSLAIPSGWDHVTTKLLLYIKPDYMGVWGEQNAYYARKMLGMKNSRIAVLGAPQYQCLFDSLHGTKLQSLRAEFREKNNLPFDKKVILFGGSLRRFNETALLKNLDDAIEDKRLTGVHIFYRPHPWREKRPQEKSFFDVGFKNVTFDESVKEAYMHAKEKNINLTPKTVMPKMTDYVSLYNGIDCMITPLSTIIVELFIYGKPSLGIGFDDDISDSFSSMGRRCNWEQFNYIKKMHFIVSSDRGSFIDDCRKLVEFTNDPKAERKIKDDIKHVVYNDDARYSQRLLKAVEALLNKKGD
ncbi:MAG: hypothetical protein V2A72_06085 [Candidatus Omnitrophota bacterium]